MPFLAPLLPAVLGYAAYGAAGVIFSPLVGYLAGGIVAAGVSSLLAPDVDAPDSLESMRTQGRQENISNPAQPIPVIYGTVRVGGSRVFADTSGTDNRYLHAVIAFCEGEINAVTAVYLDDLDATDAKFSGLIDYGDGISTHVGTDTQTADAALVSRVTDWTTDHRLLGTAYTYVRLDFDPEAFPRMPTITADIEGRLVYDVRDTLTKFSDNSALCIYDYMTNTRFGMSIPSSELDTSSFQVAANICDVVVDGQSQYTCDGVVDTDRPVLDNLKELLSSCRGMVIWTGGQYRLIIDDSESSVYSFDEDNIAGAWSLNFDSRAMRKNRVTARYFSETRRYQPDFVIQDSTAYRAEDNGTVLEREIALPFTTNYKRAQRIAEQELKQSRFSKIVEFNTLMDGLRAEVGDVVDITHSTTGWVNKEFRVLGIEYNSQNTVRIRCRGYDGSVYSGDSLPTESTPPTAANPRPNDITPTVLDAIEQSVTWIDTFENDTDDWIGSGAIIVQDGDAAVGNAAALMTATGSTAGDVVTYILPNSFWYAATIPGRQVRVQFWYKQPAANASNNARVELTNGTNTENLDIVPTASYQSAGFLFTPAVIGSTLELNVYPDRDATNEAVLIDNITCFVVPDIINAASISDWMAAAAIGTAYIADLAVTNAKIAALAVDNAKIANATITGAKIGNAEVDTLQVAGNAITAPAGAYTAGTVSITSTTWIDIQSVTIDAEGNPVYVAYGGFSDFGYDEDTQPARPHAYRLLNNGAVVVDWGSIVNGVQSEDPHITSLHYYISSPGSGSRTYKIQARAPTGQSGTATIGKRTLFAIGTKR